MARLFSWLTRDCAEVVCLPDGDTQRNTPIEFVNSHPIWGDATKNVIGVPSNVGEMGKNQRHFYEGHRLRQMRPIRCAEFPHLKDYSEKTLHLKKDAAGTADDLSSCPLR